MSNPVPGKDPQSHGGVANDAPTVPPSSGSWVRESLLVLGVSLGASAVTSLLSLVTKLTADGGLSARVTSMNRLTTPDRPWLEVLWQLAHMAIALVPVVLACHCLAGSAPQPVVAAPRRRASLVGWAAPVWPLLGLSTGSVWRECLRGIGIAGVIGLPGLALYLVSRAWGVNTTVTTAPDAQWWTVPLLVLAAAQNSVLEEVLMVGYLFERWTRAGWSPWRIIAVSAVIRGCYHAYQGFGGWLGNTVMGLAFVWYYHRTGRLWPLVVAHFLLDVVAFVGGMWVSP